MRYFQDGHSRIYVDDPGTCHDQHPRKDPPLYHVLQSNSAAAYLVRCPASLSESEQDRLNASPVRHVAPGSPNGTLPTPTTGATSTKSLKATQRAKGRN